MAKPLRGQTAHVKAFEVTQGALPHWEAPGDAYFVTVCLPRPPPLGLTRPGIGPLVTEDLRHWDGIRYYLFDYTVMPDHVHAIPKPIVSDGQSERLARVLYSLKHWSAGRINSALGRSGPVWQTESYDHMLRNYDDYLGKAAYILDNPRRAGLIVDPTEWPWWGIGSCGRTP